MSDQQDIEKGSSRRASHRDYAEGSNGSDLEQKGSNTNELRQMLTNNTLSDEQFERMFLSPRNRGVAGDLRKRLANPTPLAIMGFSTGLTPLAAQLMGWRGSGGSAQSSVGATIWFGGMLLIFAGLGEFILGNTFPFLVFMGYGAHFLTFATTFLPAFNAVSAYTTGNPYIGEGNQELTPEFAASYGFYPLSLCILSVIFLMCSTRTNLFFFLIFVAASMGFGFATGSFWQIANGNMALGNQFLVATGACFWAAAMLGWYLLIAMMIPIMELPLPSLPIVDLSTIVKPKKAKMPM